MGAIAVIAPVLLGAAVGGGVATFDYAKGTSYLSSASETCANCHVMQDHYDAWVKLTHHNVASPMKNINNACPTRFFVRLRSRIRQNSVLIPPEFCRLHRRQPPRFRISKGSTGIIARIKKCPLGLSDHEVLCPLHRLLDDASRLVEQSFQSVTVGDLINPPKQAKSCSFPSKKKR